MTKNKALYTGQSRRTRPPRHERPGALSHHTCVSFFERMPDDGGPSFLHNGLDHVAVDDVVHARAAWAPIDYESIRLRIGPNYRRNGQKAPTGKPLLPCISVQLLQSETKVFCDGDSDASCLPAEVQAAAAEPTPSPRADQKPPLPRYLVVSFSMPRYSGSAESGPTLRFTYVYAVPPKLRSEPGAAAAMCCEFLDGSASGHTDPQGRFYDRFKVIARCVHVDKPMGPFLRKMVQWFNAKPMLWRFFGVWGNCSRRGAATFVNLDFCTGGRLKNKAFSEGLAIANNTVVFDLAFTLEARSDEEMPETLLGGATACRVNFQTAPEIFRVDDGTYALRIEDEGEPGSFWRVVL